VIKQRSLNNTGRLSAKRKARLDELGFVWDARESTWETRFAELGCYKERFGDCNVPALWKESPKLGHWVRFQRNANDVGKLPSECKTRLDELGFVWGALDAAWETGFTELRQYRDIHGNCNVPAVCKDNPKLGRWVHTQRVLKAAGKLSSERRARLEGLGLIWDRHDVAWEVRFDELRCYRDKHGNCNVSQTSGQLGWWVGQQRALRTRGTLSSMRKARLDEIGFVWAPRPPWDTMFGELKRYKDEHGHCNVPAGCERNPQLARWVVTQRKRWGSLSSARKARLDGLGFLSSV
jgi:hypothetical protein